MPTRIDIPNWYQLDFDITTARITLQNIAKLVAELKKKKIIDKWFYLFEGNSIRVRFYSVKQSELEKVITISAKKLGLTISSDHTFEQYWETTDAFSNIEVAETFANIMASLTELSITRIDKPGVFNNYKLVERLSHCIFNNVYGSPTEEYFLLKRFAQRFGDNIDSLNDNPEQTVLDNDPKYIQTQQTTLTVPSLIVPIK